MIYLELLNHIIKSQRKDALTGFQNHRENVHLIPMLRTNPMETKSSIACQVDSRDMVVSTSNTPSLSRALAVAPTPVIIQTSLKLNKICGFKDGPSNPGLVKPWASATGFYRHYDAEYLTQLITALAKTKKIETIAYDCPRSSPNPPKPENDS